VRLQIVLQRLSAALKVRQGRLNRYGSGLDNGRGQAAALYALQSTQQRFLGMLATFLLRQAALPLLAQQCLCSLFAVLHQLQRRSILPLLWQEKLR